jgi:hypothetical protein
VRVGAVVGWRLRVSIVNPLAHLSNDDLVATHSLHPLDSHYLTEMLRRHMGASEKLGNKIWWLNLWLLAFTVAIFVLTGVLVWTALHEVEYVRRQSMLVSSRTEGAWVLWESTGSSKTNTVSSEPVAAQATRQACERELGESLGQFKSSPGMTVRVDDKNHEAFVTMTPKGGRPTTTFFKYLCLPDTVDPRGPKGK